MVLAFLGSALAQTPVFYIEPLVRDGDFFSGSTVKQVYWPDTNSLGEYAVQGRLADNRLFIWANGTATVYPTEFMPNATVRRRMGFADSGRFVWLAQFSGALGDYHIYDDSSLDIDPNAGAWLKQGAPTTENDGSSFTRLRVPSITAGGAVFFWADITGKGDSLVVSRDGTVDNLDILLAEGDAAGNVTVGSLEHQYDVSDDGTRIVIRGKDSNLKQYLFEGTGSPSPVWNDFQAAESPDEFEILSINNSGDKVYAGVGHPPPDDLPQRYLSFNGVIRLKAGDTVDGILLGDNIRAAAIDNRGTVAFSWVSGVNEALFVVCEAPNNSDWTTAAHLALLTDLGPAPNVDTTGDGEADTLLNEFSHTSGDGWLFDLADRDEVILTAQLGDTAQEAVIRVPYSCCNTGDRSYGDVDGDDICEDVDLCFGIDSTGDDDSDEVCNDQDQCQGDDKTGDDDEDSFCNDIDLCLGDNSSGDDDADALCNDRDPCFGDHENFPDTDGDGVCEDVDACFGDDTSGDDDSDAVCNDLDLCDGDDASGNDDADTLCNDIDPCFGDHDDFPDTDGDGICEDLDVCRGDDASGDTDQDDVCDDIDACDGDDASGNADGDALCDDIDACFGTNLTGDDDNDGVCNDADQCEGDDASGDDDGDQVCNDTDACFGTNSTGNADGDAFCNDADACLGDNDSGDSDSDGWCDDQDPCFGDNDSGDTDGDSVCDDLDACVGDDASGDSDGDDVCDDLDACFGADASGDTDQDGVCDDSDVCLGDDASGDSDGDDVCDDADLCEGADASGDDDLDGICNDNDVCIGLNSSGDTDEDGICDNRDLCVGMDAAGDSDDDGTCDDEDLCPGFDDELDSDEDGIPDGCEEPDEPEDTADTAESDPPETPAPPVEEDCGCKSTGSTGWWSVVGLLVILRRRK